MKDKLLNGRGLNKLIGMIKGVLLTKADKTDVGPVKTVWNTTATLPTGQNLIVLTNAIAAKRDIIASNDSLWRCTSVTEGVETSVYTYSYVQPSSDEFRADMDAVTFEIENGVLSVSAIQKTEDIMVTSYTADADDNLTNITIGGSNLGVGVVDGLTSPEVDNLWNGGYATRATVSNLGAQDPTTVVFTKDADFTVSGLGIEEVVVDGDTFIKIPTMYRKINTIDTSDVHYDQITSFTMSNVKLDDTYEPYPVFIAEDGTTVLPYVLIGKYWNTSESSMVSTTETGNTAVATIANARTYARNRGAGYQQYDWMFQKLWQDLVIILTGNVIINGEDGTNYDALGIYWCETVRTFWIDGIANVDYDIVASNTPSAYIDSPSTNTAGYYSAGYEFEYADGVEIHALGYKIGRAHV